MKRLTDARIAEIVQTDKAENLRRAAIEVSEWVERRVDQEMGATE